VNFARSWEFDSIRSVPGASRARLMASARHGGHRGRDVARERELDLERSRRSKEYHHHRRHSSRDRGSERRSDGGRSKVRERSDRYSRHLSPPRSRPSGIVEDKEPGELSSGSGSEEIRGRSLKAREWGDNGVEGVCRYGGALSPSRKRRHSPVLDSNASKLQVTDSARSRREVDVVATELPLPSPPPLSDASTVATAGECSPMNLDMSIRSHEAERLLDYEKDKVMEGEEVYRMRRNIFTSRWANAEEEEEVVVPQKKKSISPANSVEKRSAKRAISPESGELLGMSVGNSSISPNSMLVQGSENEDFDVDEGNCMDVAMERDIDSPADYLLDTDVESNVHRSRTPENVQAPHRCINMLQSCRTIDEFKRLNTINEGTYGVVFRVRDKKINEVVALKKVKIDKERDREGFPLTALREINILLSLHHPSIVDVKEVIVGGPDNDTFMVMEYMEHDLKGVMEAMKQPYHQSEVKCLMFQLLEGVKCLHDNWVLHR
jgi:cell division cycle 2-like